MISSASPHHFLLGFQVLPCSIGKAPPGQRLLGSSVPRVVLPRCFRSYDRVVPVFLPWHRRLLQVLLLGIILEMRMSWISYVTRTSDLLAVVFLMAQMGSWLLALTSSSLTLQSDSSLFALAMARGALQSCRVLVSLQMLRFCDSFANAELAGVCCF
mmetsp:Transcript_77672/g.222617  ORF Transcript_77672/g.222617 Transcript_77672/m.222617 type:complete len:157 (+) Transcript_77672:92-562(+)